MDIFLSSDPGSYRLADFCDGRIATEDGSAFRIHRVLLSQKSAYFRGLFFFYRNKEFPDFAVPGISGPTMRRVLSFIYSGHAELDGHNVLDTLLAANYLVVEELSECCQVYIMREINVKNCVPAFVACKGIDTAGDIVDELYRFMETHFEEIVHRSPGDIGSLPEEVLEQLLDDMSINISSEKTIWKAILLWVENKTSERYGAVPKLLSRLTLTGIGETLSTEIISHPIVKGNIFCAEINNQTFAHPATSNHLILEQYIRSLQGPSREMPFKWRQPTSINYVAIYIVSTEGRTLDIRQTYDQHLDLWTKVGEIHLDPFHTFDYFVRAGARLFAFDTWGHHCVSFDLFRRQWVELNPTFFGCTNYCVVETGGRIYLLGGTTESGEPVSAVEFYDQRFDEWCPVSPFHPMILTDAVGLGGRIYAFGHDVGGGKFEMVAQVYVPGSDLWTPIRPPGVERYRFSAVARASTLWLIGGEDSLTSVEEFDPESQEWRELPRLPSPYGLPRADEVCGTVYVYDDHAEDRRFYRTNPPVYWDAEIQNWAIVDASSPMHDMDRFRFCNVSDPLTVRQITMDNRRLDVQWQKSPFSKKW